MDDLELEALFEKSDELTEEEFSASRQKSGSSVIRCKCGELVQITLPCICPRCQDPKSYWRMATGQVLKLKDIKLGHLTNIIKLLGSKAEEYSSLPEFRSAIEIAMDLVYAELGSREKEIAQLSRIGKALGVS